MLSGRYVTDHRARHWSNINPSGYCQLCTITRRPATPGTLEQMLLACPVLADTRKKAASLWKQKLSEYPSLLPIIKHHTLAPGQAGVELTMQLLLDPSTCPMVITVVQASGIGVLSHLLHMTRTWCHSHHLKRRKLLKLYNIIWIQSQPHSWKANDNNTLCYEICLCLRMTQLIFFCCKFVCLFANIWD